MGSSQKKATNWWPIRVINASWLWERMPGVLRTDEPAFAAVHSSTNCLWRKYYTRHHEAKCETNQSKDEAVLGMLTIGIMQCSSFSNGVYGNCHGSLLSHHQRDRPSSEIISSADGGILAQLQGRYL